MNQKNYQGNKPLRELMLDLHQSEIKKVYDLPNSVKLNYNRGSTQILVDSIPMYLYLSSRLSDKPYRDQLRMQRKRRRDAIRELHDSPNEYSADEFFHRQFDYELLGLDHLVDFDSITRLTKNDSKHYSSITVSNLGRSFFDHVFQTEIECLGCVLPSNTNDNFQYFEGKNFEFFVKNTTTRYKLIDIINDPIKIRRKLLKRYSFLKDIYPTISSQDDAYESLRDLHRKRMLARFENQEIIGSYSPEIQDYLNFISEAIDYNEENRILRSVSFFYATKLDPHLGKRFHTLLGERA